MYFYRPKFGSTCPHGKASPLTPGLWGRKVQRLLHAPSKESRQLVLKTPELPDAFQESIFKGQLREQGVPGCVISSCRVL